MKSSTLIYVIVSCVVVNFVTQTTCKDIPRKWENIAKLNGSVGNTPNLRIVGGVPAKIEDFPWIVSLIYKKSSLCGGSIISSKRILTAGHCTNQRSASGFMVSVGSELIANGQVVKVSKIIVHPKYTGVNNDISIVFLATELKMSSKVAFINLPKQDQNVNDGVVVRVAGWGTTSENGWSSESLRTVTLPIIGNKRCAKMNSNVIAKSMVCAGLVKGGKDACQGDSGGPLSLKKTLIGIVSFGVGCARPNKPGVYTRVAHYTDWINSYM